MVSSFLVQDSHVALGMLQQPHGDCAPMVLGMSHGHQADLELYPNLHVFGSGSSSASGLETRVMLQTSSMCSLAATPCQYKMSVQYASTQSLEHPVNRKL